MELISLTKSSGSDWPFLTCTIRVHNGDEFEMQMCSSQSYNEPHLNFQTLSMRHVDLGFIEKRKQRLFKKLTNVLMNASSNMDAQVST